MNRVVTSALVACALLLTLAGSTGFAAPVIINFDLTPGGDPVANGTIINSLYASLGVSFDHVGPGAICGSGPEVYASSNCLARGPISAPNIVTLCPEASCSDINSTFGTIRATFDNPAEVVCIDWMGDDDNQRGILSAYDGLGNLLASTVSPDGKLQTLCVQVAGIHSVQFTGFETGFGWFDNLQVTFAPVPTLPTTLGRIKAHYR